MKDMAIVILKSTRDRLAAKIKKIKDDISQNTKDIGEAAAKGDLSENAEYDAAKERQVMLFHALRHWEGYVGGRSVDSNEIKDNQAVFGTNVTLKNMKKDFEETFQLVGPVEYELELYPNIMTYTSPLAQLLLNKTVGDEVEFEARRGIITYKITSLSKIK